GLRRTYAVSCWRASATMRLLLPNRSPRDIRTLAPSRAGHGHHPLLRARRERPRRRRAAEQSDELAPLHSITPSAQASNLAGTSISRALAVLMLTTSSNFVGSSSGNSLGFAPLKILSTNAAARRKLSDSSTP